MPGQSDERETIETYHCPQCGHDFETRGEERTTCPVCGTTCERDKCLVHFTSDEDY